MKKDKKRKWRFPFKLFIFVVLVVGLIVYVSATTKYWDGKSKVSLAVSQENGDVEVLVFDPLGGSLTTIEIPQSTEVTLSRQLGKWRLKNVPKIGDKEGLYGTLLVETLTRYFKFPVYLWGSNATIALSGGPLGSELTALFSPGRTNLGFGDRLQILLFSMNVKNYKKETINLARSKYLKESTLPDGDHGYEVSGSIPSDIASVFVDPYLSDMPGRTKIVDKSGREIGKKIGLIVEVVGLNVVSVGSEEPEDLDCTVGGVNERLVNVVARLFSCKTVGEGDLDVVITLGEGFGKRY